MNKKNKKIERQLKIISKFQARAYHNSTIVPEIRLAGKWLRASGFEEGKQVNVTIQKNKLTITVDQEKSL